jgi:F-type H+-transporting ATPase subunit a
LKSSQLSYSQILFIILLLIGIANFSGVIPFGFTLSSHFSFTIFLSSMFFLGINGLGIRVFGVEMFGLFLPNGAPLVIAPFLILIELLSYVSRMLSLAIRLFANMVSGHILLKILSSFAIQSLLAQGFVNFIIIILIQIFFCLELGVALLQVYIFGTLCLLYLRDILNVKDH